MSRQNWQRLGGTALLLLALAAPALRAAAAPTGSRPLQEASIDDLIADFEGDGMTNQTRAHAASQRLTAIGARAVPALVAATADKSPWIRLWSVATLCEIGDPRAVEPALRLMHDPDTLVRAVAVWNASRFAETSEQVADAVAARMGDAEADVRDYAKRAIVDHKLTAAEPILISLLEHKSVDVRADAFVALTLLRGESIRANAEQILTARPPAPPLRLATAYRALREVPPDIAAVEFYKTAINDTDAAVRVEGVLGLEWLLRVGVLSPKPGIPAVLTGDDARALRDLLLAKLPPWLSAEYPPLRAQALAALATIRGDEVMPQIQAGLKDKAPIVREFALRALVNAGIKDKRVLEPALAALSDADAGVRKAAYVTLLATTGGQLPAFRADAPEDERRTQAGEVDAAVQAYLAGRGQ